MTAPEVPTTSASSRRDELEEAVGGSLRAAAAGGVIVNAGFALAVQGVTVLRGLVVAAFLTPKDFGAWAVIVVSITALGQLKEVGVVDKYIQQNEHDQRLAFQHAFTIEATLTVVVALTFAAIVPLVAVLFDAPAIVAPALVSLLAVPANILQAPLWTLQRSMAFRRWRTLSAIDPIVAALVTIFAAALGAGIWSFVIGTVVGAWTGALMIAMRSTHPMRLRYDPGVARQYASFAWPLLLSNLSTAALISGTTLVARSATGLAGVGAMALSNPIRLYAEFADRIVSEAMYPAVCAARDRADILRESFEKSNRLALMWGVPIGVGVAVFTADLVRFVLGPHWAYGADLFRAVGLASAIGHVAFNWDDYVRAMGDTRPIARYSWLTLFGWGVGPIVLLIVGGLQGYGIGLVAMSLFTVALRAHFLRNLFPDFAIMRHAWRALAPTLPAAATVLAVRAAETGPRTALEAVVELALYVILAAGMTWLAERTLLREAFGYLRRPVGLRAP